MEQDNQPQAVIAVSPDPKKKPAWLLIALLAVIVLGGLSVVLVMLFSAADDTNINSFKDAMGAANDKFEREKQMKLQLGQILDDPELQAFLEPNYPAETYYIEADKYFVEGDFAAFQLSYNTGSGGDIPILLVQKAPTGYQIILDNQRILSHDVVDDTFTPMLEIDCDLLSQIGVPQSIYEAFLRLNSSVYDTSDVAACQLAE